MQTFQRSSHTIHHCDRTDYIRNCDVPRVALPEHCHSFWRKLRSSFKPQTLTLLFVVVLPEFPDGIPFPAVWLFGDSLCGRILC